MNAPFLRGRLVAMMLLWKRREVHNALDCRLLNKTTRYNDD